MSLVSTTLEAQCLLPTFACLRPTGLHPRQLAVLARQVEGRRRVTLHHVRDELIPYVTITLRGIALIRTFRSRCHLSDITKRAIHPAHSLVSDGLIRITARQQTPINQSAVRLVANEL